LIRAQPAPQYGRGTFLEVADVKKWCLALLAGMCGAAIVLAACGGGGDDDNGDNGGSTATRNPRTATAAAGRTGTPGAGGTNAAGTTAAEGTAGSNSNGTPAPGTTPVPGQTTAAGTTPGANATGPTPSGDPYIPFAPTPSTSDADAVADVDEDLRGGDPNGEPEVVTDLPPIPDDATIDPPTIAPPNVSTGALEFIVDANASEPGVQTSRTVRVGDVFRVAVVISNVPSPGLTTFNFFLNYDLTKVIAPTIINGSSLARNPDINEDGLGGTAAGWVCQPPAPEGDADEPGLLPGDGDPSTGQAAISCYTPGAAPQTGTLVLATVQFQAVASGSFEIGLDTTSDFGAAAFDTGFTAFAACPAALGPQVPCRRVSITVD
jgi:hypothetical protein